MNKNKENKKAGQNKWLYGITAFAILLVAVGFAGAREFGGFGTNQQGQNFGMMGNFQNAGQRMHGGFAGMQEMHTQVETALENNDYNAFVKIHEDYGMPMQITQDQFAQMAEWHEAVESGDQAKIAELQKEGFGAGFGMMGKGFGNDAGDNRNDFGGCPMRG